MPNTPGYEHPAHRVAHCALGAQRLALQLARNVDMPDDLRDVATKIALLVSEIPADVATVQSLVDRQQEDLRVMCEEGIALAQENTQLKRQVEGYHAADASSSASLRIPLTREPRSAASGE